MDVSVAALPPSILLSEQYFVETFVSQAGVLPYLGDPAILLKPVGK